MMRQLQVDRKGKLVGWSFAEAPPCSVRPMLEFLCDPANRQANTYNLHEVPVGVVTQSLKIIHFYVGTIFFRPNNTPNHLTVQCV